MYNSSGKVTEIQLNIYGKALSGRSRPREILSKYSFSQEERVLLNFHGIEAVNHSFVNEILSNLLRDKARVEIVNAQPYLKCVIEKEVHRLQEIIQL